MKSLTLFETNLNRILRCLLGKLPLAEALPLIVREIRRPQCLHRDCVELVQDTLAKHFTQRFAQLGWRNEAFLRAGCAVAGRVWNRQPPEEMGFTFSKNTIRMLIWITAENAATSRASKFVNVDELTTGDRLFNLFLYEAVADTMVAPNLLMKPVFRDNALIWLLFPNKLAEKYEDTPNFSADFTYWMQGENAWVLEAMQNYFADRLILLDSLKRKATSHEFVLRFGQIQKVTLDNFLASANQADRRDLTWFLNSAAKESLKSFNERDTEKRWLSRLNLSPLRVADRVKTYNAALALFHSLKELNTWHQESLAVSFYDDDYQTSQYWKSEWEERDAAKVFAKSQALIQSVSPIAS